MDWKLFGLTFGSVFLAEFGDKTQLATLAFSGQSGKPWVVFVASSFALIAATALGAAAGGIVSAWLSPIWMRRLSGVLFLAIGAWLLWPQGS
ncbi:MAG: TMEM165/GDT1 family protein [Planctomycetes bacterium]|nr:TMEM165/GDT1 family protein [Planctomycetota bacterium]